MAELTGGRTANAEASGGLVSATLPVTARAVRGHRPLETLLADNPPAHCGASGGRDKWSPPTLALPDDPANALLDALGEVLDPEIPVSLVELGLVYGVSYRYGTARIDLTFTATACPCMEFIKEDVRDRLGSEPWVHAVEINEVWDPPWTTSRISAEGRRKLKGFGVAS